MFRNLVKEQWHKDPDETYATNEGNKERAAFSEGKRHAYGPLEQVKSAADK